MKKRQWYALVIYFFTALVMSEILDFLDTGNKARALVNVFGFLGLLAIIVRLLGSELKRLSFPNSPASLPKSFLWIIGGFIAIIFAQKLAFFISSELLNLHGAPGNQGMIKEFPFIIIASAFAGPVVEELIFRKVILTALSKRYSTWIGIIVTSAIFASFHFTASGFLNLFFVSLILSYAFTKTNRLWVPISIHILNNLMATLVFIIL